MNMHISVQAIWFSIYLSMFTSPVYRCTVLRCIWNELREIYCLDNGSFADNILYVITFRGCTNNRWKGDLFTKCIYAWNVCSCLAFV